MTWLLLNIFNGLMKKRQAGFMFYHNLAKNGLLVCKIIFKVLKKILW